MDRRQFLRSVGTGCSHPLLTPSLAALFSAADSTQVASAEPPASKAFGSGYFGEWVTDAFGLPAYHYTCDQLNDVRAVTPVHKEFRLPNEHLHEVGNGRLEMVASTFGYVQVRQDEGAPKFLNTYSPQHSWYGGGIGYFSDGNNTLSTYYPGGGDSFERVLGEGYFTKIVKGLGYEIEQTLLAPFGGDPVIVSLVTLTNHSPKTVRGRWIEYWNCVNYQFSFRLWIEAATLGKSTQAAEFRHKLGARFAHQFQTATSGHGLIESQRFLGWTEEDIERWKKLEATLGKSRDPGNSRAADEDLNPPRTFLVSLDAPPDGFATNGVAFFGAGGVERPSGLAFALDNDLDTTGPESAHLLERHVTLAPGETRTLAFLYGYLPEDFDLDKLVAKYSGDTTSHWFRSSAAWKTSGIQFAAPSEPWVERELSWHNYYLRGGLTFDSFFEEPILSQGSIYQYVYGIQGAIRDQCQYALPYVFSDPAIVRGALRYTFKEVQPDGSMPFVIAGFGMPESLGTYYPSDQELWVLWLASEYVLSTRDKDFLNERVPLYPRSRALPDDPTIAEMLERAYSRVVKVTGVGEHGLMRLATGDWNDTVVRNQVPAELSAEVRKTGESCLNAAMASYVLDHYGRLLNYLGRKEEAEEARSKAEAQRAALNKQGMGRWFRRAWLGQHLGWIGEDRLWLETQPWAVIGGAAAPEQTRTLVAAIDELVRHPSLIGAMLLSMATDKDMELAPGMGENAGVWPSVNGTLIWALAKENGAMAWDEWKKNSLAFHAESYPDIWYGIWSGPDSYNSTLSTIPGEVRRADPNSPDPRAHHDSGYTDFPVMNLHPHMWPLYSLVKLLGVEFHETGVRFAPALPLPEYDFTSSLVGFRKSPSGYTGRYAPAVSGLWEIELRLPAAETARLRKIKVNGASQTVEVGAQSIRFQGESKPGAPLLWEIYPA